MSYSSTFFVRLFLRQNLTLLGAIFLVTPNIEKRLTAVVSKSMSVNREIFEIIMSMLKLASLLITLKLILDF